MASFCEGKVAVVTGAGGTLCSCIAKDLVGLPQNKHLGSFFSLLLLLSAIIFYPEL